MIAHLVAVTKIQKCIYLCYLYLADLTEKLKHIKCILYFYASRLLIFSYNNSIFLLANQNIKRQFIILRRDVDLIFFFTYKLLC